MGKTMTVSRHNIKTLVHPEGYGFWLDPDGALTLVLTVITVGTLFGAIGGPQSIGELLRAHLWDSPVTSLLLLVCLVLLACRVISATSPEDFARTGHFHLWVAVIGVVLVAGAMAIWCWPGLPEWKNTSLLDWSIRLGAVAAYLLTAGTSIRRRMEVRRAWVREEMERTGANERLRAIGLSVI